MAYTDYHMNVLINFNDLTNLFSMQYQIELKRVYINSINNVNI